METLKKGGAPASVENGERSEQYQLLYRRLVQAQEEERTRLARELHDHMAQHLAAMSVGLQSLKESSANGRVSPDDFQQLQRISEELVDVVHQIAVELRPPALDEIGLSAALTNYTDNWSRRAGIQFIAHVDGFDGDQRHLDPTIALAIYRIVQESLTNVLKHAKATSVSLILQRKPDYILAIVEDDGIGFNQEKIVEIPRRPALGLLGIRERAALVGGTVEIESKRNSGTTVFLKVPLTCQTF